jgi:hypothetical protein
VFIGLIIYSAANIGFEPPSEIYTTMEGNLIRFDAPFKISNNGFFDITNLRILVEITNLTNSNFATFNKTIPVIASKTVYSDNLTLTINATKLIQDFSGNFARNDYFKISVNVDCYYSLVGFSASFFKTFDMPIKNLNVSVDTANIAVIFQNNQTKITVPCIISYEGSLNIDNIQTDFKLFNSTNYLITSTTASIPQISPGNNNIPLDFTINTTGTLYLLTRDDVLRVDAKVTAYGFTFERHVNYNWGAPLYNFTIGNISLSPPPPNWMLKIPVRWENHAPMSYSTDINVNIYNVTATRTIIGTSVTSASLQPYEIYNNNFTVALTSTPNIGNRLEINLSLTSPNLPTYSRIEYYTVG